MKTFNIIVAGRVARCRERDGDIICDNSGYKAKFTFDSEWDGHAEKTARFIWGGEYYDVPFTGDEVSIPAVFDTEELHVGVYVGELKTTTSAVIPCRPSIKSKGGNLRSELSKEYRDQAVTSAEQAMAAATAAAASAAEAKESAREAANAAGGGAVDAYTKAETYSKTEVDAKFEALPETYSKAELDAMLGAYVTDMANLIGGEALADS